MVDSDSETLGNAGAISRGGERRRRWRFVRWACGLSLLVFAAGVSYLAFVGFDSKFYHPERRVNFGGFDLEITPEEVWFTASDGVRLHGWFVEAVGESRGMVVHFHGNAGDITNHIATVAWLPPRHYDVLLFDYRGYGKSEGEPSREGTVRDGLAAIEYAVTRPEYQPGRLFAYGQSLGGAIAAVVAAEREELRAVVLEATFSGYREIGAALLRKRVVYFNIIARPIAWLGLSGDHDPIDVIDQLSPRPLLVITGEKDTVCYPELGRELYEAAGEPKEYLMVDGAAHWQALRMSGSELKRKIVETFEKGVAAPVE